MIPTSLSRLNDVFHDDNWNKELDGIPVEVQEIYGLWSKVTLFRHKTHTCTSRVCIWFGGMEYEGIDPELAYAYYCICSSYTPVSL